MGFDGQLALYARHHVGLGRSEFANNGVELEVSLFVFNSNRSFFFRSFA